jgi:hypothetical protein
VRPQTLTDEKLTAALSQGALHTAAELADRLDVSQPTISRGLNRLAGKVVRIGLGRASRYSLARPINRLGSRWPLYRINAEGRPEHLGDLFSIMAGHWYLHSPEPRQALMQNEFREGVYPDLPWFLEDLKPQGFLGRAFVQAHAEELDVPAELTAWNSDHVLAALLRHGDNLPGDLVVGDDALESALHELVNPLCIAPDERPDKYPRMAASALRGQSVGSSAGGEQPKFTVQLREEDGTFRAAIVKFSEPQNTPSAIRWADLLQCEHLAGTVLSENGVRAAQTHVLDSEGRRFLQSTRFDRTPSLGRRGYVSLRALDAAHIGKARAPWPEMAEILLGSGWIDADTAHELTVAGLFGDLIGNNDMHFGNVAFELTDNQPLGLVPFFDMLPMLYAPGNTGALVDRNFEPRPPLPRHMAAWRFAAQMASSFWQRVASDPWISPSFVEIARANGRTVDTLRSRFG